MKDVNSLSHSKWRCKYHIVFAPKYRRQAIYGEIKRDIGKILRQLCENKGVRIIEAELCKDHIHMLVEIPPNISVSQFVGYLKGKSTARRYNERSNDDERIYRSVYRRKVSEGINKGRFSGGLRNKCGWQIFRCILRCGW